jgi:hypothetical protein
MEIHTIFRTKRPTLCDTSELFKDTVNVYSGIIFTGLNAISACIYLLIWLVVRKNIQGDFLKEFWEELKKIPLK